MTGKGFAGLVAAVLVVAAAATWMQRQERTQHAAAPAQQLFPSLQADLARVDSVSVKSAAGLEVTLQRTGDRWAVAQRDGYPADAGVLSREMRKLAQVGGVEAKTRSPERYPSLGVDALDTAKAPTVEVAASVGDAAVVDVLIGKVGKTGHYLRAVGDEQSWLGDQRFAWPTQLADWLQRDIVDVTGADMKSVAVTPAEGSGYTVARAERGQELTLAPAPAQGREASAANLNRLAAALSRLRLRDVRRSAETDGGDWTTSRFETLDGLIVTVRSHAEEDQYWIRLEAEGGAEDMAAKANEINARVAGWDYEISDYNGKALAFAYETLLKPEDKPED